MRNSSLIVLGFCVWIAGCAGIGGGVQTSTPPGVEAMLKLSAGSGKLKAKLTFKNNTSREVELKELDSKFFTVQTVKDEPMAPKSSKGESHPPVRLKPGETQEIAFNLQDNYPFWDRLTKYKIWYEAGALKSNVAQVWF